MNKIMVSNILYIIIFGFIGSFLLFCGFLAGNSKEELIQFLDREHVTIRDQLNEERAKADNHDTNNVNILLSKSVGFLLTKFCIKKPSISTEKDFRECFSQSFSHLSYDSLVRKTVEEQFNRWIEELKEEAKDNI